MPRRTKFTDFEPMQKELAALHEENARLKDELLDRNGHVLRLTRERDDAVEMHKTCAQREEGR